MSIDLAAAYRDLHDFDPFHYRDMGGRPPETKEEVGHYIHKAEKMWMTLGFILTKGGGCLYFKNYGKFELAMWRICFLEYVPDFFWRAPTPEEHGGVPCTRGPIDGMCLVGETRGRVVVSCVEQGCSVPRREWRPEDIIYCLACAVPPQ